MKKEQNVIPSVTRISLHCIKSIHLTTLSSISLYINKYNDNTKNPAGIHYIVSMKCLGYPWKKTIEVQCPVAITMIGAQ